MHLLIYLFIAHRYTINSSFAPVLLEHQHDMFSTSFIGTIIKYLNNRWTNFYSFCIQIRMLPQLFRGLILPSQRPLYIHGTWLGYKSYRAPQPIQIVSVSYQGRKIGSYSLIEYPPIPYSSVCVLAEHWWKVIKALYFLI